ncbi:class I adenylate-forming enzyme family protein [Mycetocola sp.]|jgi:long-chain acyl-CoA synthetase|uniref:class I adenylate-forming enzyme family protein n=1 Tax=Mycetocola sp. TaxID=1871042 RepID=UPI00261551AB|nr:fatty acid--CoA ligase family protein [Mycetocola sp.]MCU1561041.1 long-chain fatty acid--CoA ligase [Mycetocola sp.]
MALARRTLDERAAGRIPLLGDDRWSEQQWKVVQDRVDAAGPQPGQAWAALSSGSTGEPRIVLRTADSWAASFSYVAELLDAGPDDVLALSSPPASSLSLFSIAHSAEAGFTLALPRAHSLTAEDARDASLFHGTPNGLRTLLDAGTPSRLRAALIGGTSLDLALRARAEAQGIRVISYYGAAELSFVAIDDVRADDAGGRGFRAFPGVEFEVRDDDVLWVHSPYVSTGYLTGTGPMRQGAGWCTVGDRARLEEGRLTLLGRDDDAILTAGATVIPADVEQELRRIDGVDDAVVFGLPNDGVGELVTAVIEAAPGSSLRRAELRADAASRLPATHLPRRWFVVDHLPRTVTGKTARAELIHRVRSGEVASLAR